jgi:anti-sigma B factor antagonist
MFNIEYSPDLETIFLRGNFDTSKAEEVIEVFDMVEKSVNVDMSELQFICSSGIGVMVTVYKKLKEKGEDICLVNLNEHISKVFKLSLLDKVFTIK